MWHADSLGKWGVGDMAEKLTLVVTCTDRKSSQPSDSLRMGKLPGGPQVERASRWRNALQGEPRRKQLRHLYQGDSWTQALRLEEAARRAGYDPTLLVASAGLGLVSADEEWPAYAATFSPRHEDTIGLSRADNRSWWGLITADQESLSERSPGQTLMVLSDTYAAAMAEDVTPFQGRSDVVIFGGSRDVPDHLRIPSDRRLRSALGGTAGSLNLRTAIAWVEGLSGRDWRGCRESPEWRAWVDEKSSAPETYDRTPVADVDVINFIRDLRRIQPGITKSRALRTFRDAGLACEQKRFSGLFATAVKEQE